MICVVGALFDNHLVVSLLRSLSHIIFLIARPASFCVANGKIYSIGNRRFRVTIECNTAQYSRVSTPPEKAYIVLSIMNTIRGKSPDGGFVKKRGDGEEGWVEVGDIVAVSVCTMYPC